MRLLVAGCLLGATAVLGVGQVLVAPSRADVGVPPPDLQAESVQIARADGGQVAGWAVAGRPGTGAVLLLHGVRANRRSMLARAVFLHRLGYNVLLIDLPAHGQSGGSHITYGWDESQGVKAALDDMARRWPGERLGVIGVSLGAASLVMARDARPAAVVLESMFPTIEEALQDRLRLHLGAWGPSLAPLLLPQLPWRLGLTPQQLRPIDAMAALPCPVLVASGALDQHTTLAETQRLFAAAPNPKVLWVVPGAAHVDLHAFTPAAYEARIADFLGRYLRR
jgi:fermentation-respiration switch protein FrsA (DUF1100 family)